MANSKKGRCGCKTPNRRPKSVTVKPHRRGKPRKCK